MKSCLGDAETPRLAQNLSHLPKASKRMRKHESSHGFWYEVNENHVKNKQKQVAFETGQM